MTRTKLLALVAAPALALSLASPALAVEVTAASPDTVNSPVGSIGANQSKIVTVTCPAGTNAVSGGWKVSSASIDVTDNRPMSATQWQITFQNEAKTSGTVQVFARCVA
ncbi:hypothetical protein ABZ312_39380 [Streptomyces sp. NPDC006207]|nr:hypothetical protein [Streptomyces sp. PA03-6a]